MGKFRPFLTELYASNTSVFYFHDNNLSKSQWILIKFDMYIDTVGICFGIAHGQISSIFDRVICLRHDNGGVLSFHVLSSSVKFFFSTLPFFGRQLDMIEVPLIGPLNVQVTCECFAVYPCSC